MNDDPATEASQRSRVLFEDLVAKGVLSRDELDEAIGEARRQGQPVAQVLIDAMYVPRDTVGQSLANYYGVPFVAFKADFRIDPAC